LFLNLTDKLVYKENKFHIISTVQEATNCKLNCKTSHKHFNERTSYKITDRSANTSEVIDEGGFTVVDLQ